MGGVGGGGLKASKLGTLNIRNFIKNVDRQFSVVLTFLLSLHPAAL